MSPCAGLRWPSCLLLLIVVLFAQVSPVSAAREPGKKIILILDGTSLARETDPNAQSFQAARMILSLLPPKSRGGVILAEEKPQILSSLTRWSDRKLSRLKSKLDGYQAQSQFADLSGAIRKAGSMFGKPDGGQRIVMLIIASPLPEYPNHSFVQELQDQQVALHIVQLVTEEVWPEWRQAAADTGGSVLGCTLDEDLPEFMFNLYVGATDPQLIPLDADTFQVDEAVKNMVIVTVRDEDSQPEVVSQKRVFASDKRKRGKTKRDRIARNDFGKLTTIKVSNPTVGHWKVSDVNKSKTMVLVDTEVTLNTILPRSQYIENEHLTLTAYLARYGEISPQRKEARNVGFMAELFNPKTGELSMATMRDDGETPDRQAGDGIYSGSIPLQGHVGPHLLRTVVRRGNLMRKQIDYITIEAGTWYTLLEPPGPADLSRDLLLSIELHPAIPLDNSLRVFAQIPPHEKAKMTSLPKNPRRYAIMVLPPEEPSEMNLKITRSGTNVPLAIDEQGSTTKLTFISPDQVGAKEKEGSSTIYLLIVFIVVAGIGGAAILYIQKRKQAGMEVEAEFEPEEMPEEITPLSTEPVSENDIFAEESEEEAPEPATPEEEAEQEVVTNLGDRIEEVFTAHAREAHHSDFKRPETEQENLDRDSDPDYVSGTGFDDRDEWGQMISEMKDSTIKESVEEEEEIETNQGFSDMMGFASGPEPQSDTPTEKDFDNLDFRVAEPQGSSDDRPDHDGSETEEFKALSGDDLSDLFGYAYSPSKDGEESNEEEDTEKDEPEY